MATIGFATLQILLTTGRMYEHTFELQSSTFSEDSQLDIAKRERTRVMESADDKGLALIRRPSTGYDLVEINTNLIESVTYRFHNKTNIGTTI